MSGNQVNLEPYSTGRHAIPQAALLSKLIRKEKGWLRTVEPDKLKRYWFIHSAARTVVRIADKKDEIAAFIIRKNDAAIGIATIIFDQQIVHPEAGTFRGDDVDYWLEMNARSHTHADVVAQLIGNDLGHSFFSTVLADHPNPALGFGGVMARVGEPASLSTGGREDPYKIARDGKLAQLYVYPPPVVDINPYT